MTVPKYHISPIIELNHLQQSDYDFNFSMKKSLMCVLFIVSKISQILKLKRTKQE